MGKFHRSVKPDTAFVLQMRGEDGLLRQVTIEGRMSIETIEVHGQNGKVQLVQGVVLYLEDESGLFIGEKGRIWRLGSEVEGRPFVRLPGVGLLDVQTIIRSGGPYKGPEFGG